MRMPCGWRHPGKVEIYAVNINNHPDKNRHYGKYARAQEKRPERQSKQGDASDNFFFKIDHRFAQRLK
jgi:hypothetical protein